MSLVFDHLFDSVDEIDGRVIVEIADVSSFEPSLSVGVDHERLGGGDGIQPIASHRGRRMDQQLANLKRIKTNGHFRAFFNNSIPSLSEAPSFRHMLRHRTSPVDIFVQRKRNRWHKVDHKNDVLKCDFA